MLPLVSPRDEARQSDDADETEPWLGVKESDIAMTDVFLPTDAQKTAAKPWVIAVFSAWIIGLVSYAVLAIVLITSPTRDLRVVAVWFGGTWLFVRVTEFVCTRRLQRMAGGTSTDRPWLGTLMTGLLLAFFLYVAFWT